MAVKSKSRGKPIRKKPKPLIRFRFGMLLFIWFLCFLGCFALYMVQVNLEEPKSPSASETADQAAASLSVSNPIPESEARDASYFDNCAWIGDSTLSQVSDTCGLSGQRVFAQAVPSFGISASATALKALSPEVVYCLFGSDAIEAALQQPASDESSGSEPVSWNSELEQSMLVIYTQTLEELESLLPDAEIVILSAIPVPSDSAPLTNAILNSWNSALLQLANQQGYAYADINTALKGVNGVLSQEAFSDLRTYLLTHTVSL